MNVVVFLERVVVAHDVWMHDAIHHVELPARQNQILVQQSFDIDPLEDVLLAICFALDYRLLALSRASSIILLYHCVLGLEPISRLTKVVSHSMISLRLEVY